jgi:hypothetical protein
MTTENVNPPISAEAIERGDLPVALDPSATPASTVIGFMREYFRVWNAKDAQALATHIYRFGPGYPLQTEADIQRLLDRTVAEGWDYSTLDAIDIYAWDGEAYLANGLYSRFTADGRPMPPVRRPTAYVVKVFPDGCRITDLPLVYRSPPQA